MSEEIVSVTDLSRRFGSTIALDRVTLTIARGTVFGLVGENGGGEDDPQFATCSASSGPRWGACAFGLDPVSEPVGVLGRIGYVSEERDLPGWMRLGELMSYTRAFYPRWDDRFARDLLTMFELNPGQKIRTLSRGQLRGSSFSSRCAPAGIPGARRALLRPRSIGPAGHPDGRRTDGGRRGADSALLVPSAPRGPAGGRPGGHAPSWPAAVG